MRRRGISVSPNRRLRRLSRMAFGSTRPEKARSPRGVDTSIDAARRSACATRSWLQWATEERSYRSVSASALGVLRRSENVEGGGAEWNFGSRSGYFSMTSGVQRLPHPAARSKNARVVRKPGNAPEMRVSSGASVGERRTQRALRVRVRNGGDDAGSFPVTSF